MEFKKFEITKRVIFTFTSLAILLFVIIFTIITFAIKEQQNVSNYSEASRLFSSQSDESFDNMDSSIIDSIPDISETESEIITDISDFSTENISDVEIEHGWIINEFGYTYVYNGCGYEQFNYKASALKRYVNTLNNFVALVPETTRMFSITVPVSSTFAEIPRDIYVNDNFYNQAQSAFVSTVSTLTDERLNHVQIIELLEESYDRGDYIFYRTDKNWTADGAYLAYRTFCEYADLQSLPISSYKRNSIEGFLGSFYTATKSESMMLTPDEYIYYSPSLDTKTSLTVYDNGLVYNDYSVCGNKVNSFNCQNAILGRDAERYEIHTTSQGCSLLIIGDESAYQLIPFLTANYKRIDFINPNKFDTPFEDFLRNRSYDDCLLICYSTNSISGDYIPTLNSLTGVNSNE